MNELETQLRSWVPRRPSPGLETNIFRKERTERIQTESEGVTTSALRPTWLVPATAGLLLMCLVFGQRNNPAISGTGSSSVLVAAALSNQSAAAWLPGSFAREQNGLPDETFEWTNGKTSTSSIAPFSRSTPPR